MLKQAPRITEETRNGFAYKIVPFGAGVAPKVRHIARLHAELLPHSPLTKVGVRFMERFYYKYLPLQGEIFGAIAYVNGQPAGFICATYDSNQFLARTLRRNFFRLLWVVMTSFPSPRRFEGLLEGLGIMRSREGRERKDGTPNVGEVLSIAVRTQYRGPEFKTEAGLEIGRDLLLGVMDAFAKSRITRARLIVDSRDLQTQGFYRRLGWQPRRHSVPGWLTPSTEFVWTPR